MSTKTLDPRLRNKWWRLTHLYKILDKQGRLVLFKPSLVQLMILAAIGPRLRAKILKYRQGGVTTLFCINYLDDALWTPGFAAAIIAHERGTLDKIFEIVKRAFDNMPESVKPSTEQDTLRSLHFDKRYDGLRLDSQIYVALKLRGGTVQALHITERAYIEGDKSRELEAGSKQAVPLTGRVTEETTANGMNEFQDGFMEDYERLELNDFDTLALFFAWHQDPQYTLPIPVKEYSEDDIKLRELIHKHYGYWITDGQLAWYNWKMADLERQNKQDEDKIGLSGKQLMRQEYPSTVLEAFQSGLGNVFDGELLQALQPAKPIREMRLKAINSEKLTIFHEPEAGKSYFFGGDPSDGTGDPAAMAVWDEDYNKCAEWYGLQRPDMLAKMAAEICEFYNNAFAGVENNMLSMILFLKDIYDNYFVTEKVDQKTQTRTKKLGWSTTGKSRDIMIDDYVMHFEEGTLKGLSSLTIKQMQTFITKEGGKREHAVGRHDDMLFADFIAIQMIKNKNKSKGRKRTFASKASGL